MELDIYDNLDRRSVSYLTKTEAEKYSRRCEDREHPGAASVIVEFEKAAGSVLTDEEDEFREES